MSTFPSPGIPQALIVICSWASDEVVVLQTMVGAFASLLLALLGCSELGGTVTIS